MSLDSVKNVDTNVLELVVSATPEQFDAACQKAYNKAKKKITSRKSMSKERRNSFGNEKHSVEFKNLKGMEKNAADDRNLTKNSKRSSFEFQDPNDPNYYENENERVFNKYYL